MLTKNKISRFKQMNSHQLNNELFNSSLWGDLEEIKYLLTSPDLKEHADIHAQDDNAFIWAAGSGHLDIVHYFIFDCRLVKTKRIEELLINDQRYDVLNMFNQRELESRLQLDLNNNNKTNKLKI